MKKEKPDAEVWILEQPIKSQIEKANSDKESSGLKTVVFKGSIQSNGWVLNVEKNISKHKPPSQYQIM